MRSILTYTLMMLFALLALDIAVPALVLLTVVLIEQVAFRVLPMRSAEQ